MSDKAYRTIVVVLLSLILVVMSIATFSQLRGQRWGSVRFTERTEDEHAFPEGQFPGAFGPNQGRQGQPQFLPQIQPQNQPQPVSPFDQPQAINQELLDNIHRLTVQNEEQANMIRELFGQLEDLRHQMLELNEQVDSANESDAGE